MAFLAIMAKISLKIRTCFKYAASDTLQHNKTSNAYFSLFSGITMERLILLQSGGFDVKAFKSQGGQSAPSTRSTSRGSDDGGSGAVVFLSLLGAAVLLAMITQLRRMSGRRKVHRQREESRLHNALADLDLEGSNRTTLETLCGTDNPLKLLEMVETRSVFEETVERFRNDNPDDPAVIFIPNLRQKLGFGFDNPRTPFNHTRMLAPATKLRCTITLPKRNVNYITTVASVSESDFYVLPPTQQGKPVLLAKFPTLTFHVTRQMDAEYSFTAHVLSQNRDGIGAVQLEHTAHINKMLYRNAPRVPIASACQFFVIRADMARGGNYRPEESQYAFQGRFVDISLGGLALLAPPTGQSPNVGDVLVFRLPDANIKDNLVAQTLKTIPGPNGTLSIHAKFTGIREINRLKLAKYLDNQKSLQGG